jgi:hypothetical protein
VGKVAGVATVVAIPYLAITNPYLVTGAASWVAEQAGLPGWLGVFTLYFCLLLLTGFLFRLLTRPMWWVFWIGSKVVSALVGSRPNAMASRS